MRRRIRLDAAFAAPTLARLPPLPKRRLKDALRRLGEDPTGTISGLDIRELDAGDGLPRLYRLRVGEWRAVFAIRTNEIIVVRIFHRRDGYGWMERLDKAEISDDTPT